jgi:L-iditol 2-dehydrogenase
LGALKGVNGGRGADVVLVAVGTVNAMEEGLAYVEKGGTVLFFAPTPPDVTVPISPYRLLFEEITVTSSYSCTPQDTRLSLKLIETGRINVDDLITHRFDLSGVGKAIDLASKAQESLKIVIVP